MSDGPARWHLATGLDLQTANLAAAAGVRELLHRRRVATYGRLRPKHRESVYRGG
jgi:hypothetical protein